MQNSKQDRLGVLFRFSLVIVALLLSSASTTRVSAENKAVNAYLFYGSTCPHCKKELAFFENYQKENPNKVNLHLFEVYQNREDARVFAEAARILGVESTAVPFLVIGNKTVVGYLDDEATGAQIANLVENCYQQTCPDPLKELTELADVTTSKLATPTAAASTITSLTSLPVLGKIELKSLSLPLLTILLAFFDGFNPCAMWVLLFLISFLLGMHNHKKMWFLGISFILASGLTYFLFLAAWLNLFLVLGFVGWLKKGIGLVAVTAGVLNLKKFQQEKQGGCETGEQQKRSQIIQRLQKLTQEKSFWLALGGIAILAVTVNLIELVCSAGLPAVYTQVLSLTPLSATAYYSYLLLYIFVFMLDDLAVFVLAMLTLRATGISSRYARFSHLVGGVVILILGLLLLFRPDWLAPGL